MYVCVCSRVRNRPRGVGLDCCLPIRRTTLQGSQHNTSLSHTAAFDFTPPPRPPPPPSRHSASSRVAVCAQLALIIRPCDCAAPPSLVRLGGCLLSLSCLCVVGCGCVLSFSCVCVVGCRPLRSRSELSWRSSNATKPKCSPPSPKSQTRGKWLKFTSRTSNARQHR